MKFTDGAWMMRPGVRVAYASQAYEIDHNETTVHILATTRPIRHRGDTLDGPVLTLTYSAPLPDVIRVRVQHFTGAAAPGPAFPINEREPSPGVACVDGEGAVLTSGRLSVHISRTDWSVRFAAGGRTLTQSPPRGLGYATVEGEGNFLQEQLTLGVGECVYGLGERFSALVKNGQAIESWNKDGGTGSEQAYKNVPFYLTNRGYGVFVNQPENVGFEVATEKVSRVQFSVPGQSLEYFVIYGATPKEILERYTALTGRPALPPAWSFGLWLTTSFTTNYDEVSVTRVLEEMTARDLPLHVFHFDCFWMRAFHWCDFEWDPRTFPDPAGMLRRFHDRGLKISVWINPYIAQRSRLFAEAAANGYLLRRANGDVFQTDQWQAGMGIVDFTNPSACRWFADHLRALADQGVDCFKTDFGERIPTDVAYHDGSDPEAMHNFYAYLYNKVVFEALQERRGKGDAVLFARSATAGCQQFPVHWGGDCTSSFESMAESLRGGLSLGLSGFGFWSHDIGGFEGKPPAAVYKRWLAFGLLSSHSRLHGSSSYRVPWEFDEESVDVLRHFTRLKCRLMPYLFGQAVAAHEQGAPVMRAMLLEFPDDPAVDYLDRQYLLGESLLVAPVFNVEGLADYYVPAGTWTHFLTGATVAGPCWIRGEEHGFQSLPLLVRPNTVLPIGRTDSRPDYDFADGVTLQVYAVDDGRAVTATIPDLTGATALTATVRRDGDRITARVPGAPRSWELLLVGIHESAAVDGGRAEADSLGLRVRPTPGSETVTIRLR